MGGGALFWPAIFLPVNGKRPWLKGCRGGPSSCPCWEHLWLPTGHEAAPASPAATAFPLELPSARLGTGQAAAGGAFKTPLLQAPSAPAGALQHSGSPSRFLYSFLTACGSRAASSSHQGLQGEGPAAHCPEKALHPPTAPRQSPHEEVPESRTRPSPRPRRAAASDPEKLAPAAGAVQGRLPGSGAA